VRYPAVLATSSGTIRAWDQQITKPTITKTLQYHAVPQPLSSAEYWMYYDECKVSRDRWLLPREQ
jgi:hypothetical protein